MFIVAALYKFTKLSDYQQLQPVLDLLRKSIGGCSNPQKDLPKTTQKLLTQKILCYRSTIIFHFHHFLIPYLSVEWLLFFKDTKDDMQQFAHHSDDDHHRLFSLFLQSLGKLFQEGVMPHSCHGRKVQKLS